MIDRYVVYVSTNFIVEYEIYSITTLKKGLAYDYAIIDVGNTRVMDLYEKEALLAIL